MTTADALADPSSKAQPQTLACPRDTALQHGGAQGLRTLWCQRVDEAGLRGQFGPRVTWHTNGSVMVSEQLHEGVRHGFFARWHMNGQLAATGVYHYGRPHGSWGEWYETGQRKREAVFRYGQLHGMEQRWHANGHRASVGRYELGQQIGMWKTWGKSGRMESSGYYLAGRRHGRWLDWHYQRGLLYTDWHKGACLYFNNACPADIRNVEAIGGTTGSELPYNLQLGREGLPVAP